MLKIPAVYLDKQKSFIPGKYMSFGEQVSISKQPALFIDPIFEWGFWLELQLGIKKRLFFSFKALHLGHIAKCFGLRDPPSQITGIGKGNWVKKEAQKKVDLKREHKVIKAQETRINQKSLVMSEYSSGFEGANLDLGIKGVLGPKKESKKSITKKKLKRLKWTVFFDLNKPFFFETCFRLFMYLGILKKG